MVFFLPVFFFHVECKKFLFLLLFFRQKKKTFQIQTNLPEIQTRQSWKAFQIWLLFCWKEAFKKETKKKSTKRKEKA